MTVDRLSKINNNCIGDESNPKYLYLVPRVYRITLTIYNHCTEIEDLQFKWIWKEKKKDYCELWSYTNMTSFFQNILCPMNMLFWFTDANVELLPVSCPFLTIHKFDCFLSFYSRMLFGIPFHFTLVRGFKYLYDDSAVLWLIASCPILTIDWFNCFLPFTVGCDLAFRQHLCEVLIDTLFKNGNFWC